MRSRLGVRNIIIFCSLAFFAVGCGDSAPTPVKTDGPELGAPVRPGLKGKAAEQMKTKMPHM